MSDKLKDIKNTASDAVEIIRELGTPEVQNSLEKIRETAKIAKEVMDSLRDPAMVANIENVRKTVESFEKSSVRMDSAIMEMKNSGILDEVRGAVGSAECNGFLWRAERNGRNGGCVERDAAFHLRTC